MRLSQNRGMFFEKIINRTLDYYLVRQEGYFWKNAVPMRIVSSCRDQSLVKAKITGAALADYGGVYRGWHLAFEAKETENKNHFIKSNVHKNQLDHLKQVVTHGGLSFIFIHFSAWEKCYLIPLELFIKTKSNNISPNNIKLKNCFVPLVYPGILDFLSVIKL